MFCKNCGAQIPAGAGFCGACGASVRVTIPSNSSNSPPERAKKKRSGDRMLLSLSAVVAAIVLLMTAIFFMYMKRQQETQLRYYQQEQQDAMARERSALHPVDTGSADSGAASANTVRVVVEDTELTQPYYYYGTSNTDEYDKDTGTDSHLWPTDQEYISRSDLNGLSQLSVRALVNEIYACHGYCFQKERWKLYFGGKSWYHADSSCTEQATAEARMNSIEKANLNTIISYEEAMGWR